MASSNSFYSDIQSDKIIVNGVSMTMAEYKKMKRQVKNKKRKKKMQNEIKLLPEDVNYLLKDIKVVDSLLAFHRNGYRQWGRIHRDLMKVDDMEHNFLLLKTASYEANEKLNEIAEEAKKSNKSTYGLISDLAYKITKLGERLNALYIVVHDSNIVNSPFNTHEIINGTGRRLGLKTLINRTGDALDNMVSIITKLQDLSVIPDDYYNNTTKFIDKKLKAV